MHGCFFFVKSPSAQPADLLVAPTAVLVRIGHFDIRLFFEIRSAAWQAPGGIAEVVEVDLDGVAAAADVGHSEPVEFRSRLALV